MAFNSVLGQIGNNDIIQELSPTTSKTEMLDKINEIIQALNELRRGISIYDAETQRVWIGPDAAGDIFIKVSAPGDDVMVTDDIDLLVKLPA